MQLASTVTSSIDDRRSLCRTAAFLDECWMKYASHAVCQSEAGEVRITCFVPEAAAPELCRMRFAALNLPHFEEAEFDLSTLLGHLHEDDGVADSFIVVSVGIGFSS